MSADTAIGLLSNETRRIPLRVRRPKLRESPKPTAGGSFAARLPEPELWICTQVSCEEGGSCAKRIFARSMPRL